MPYLGITFSLLTLALALALIKLPPLVSRHVTSDFRPAQNTDASAGRNSIWGHRWLLMAAAGIFLYVGAEVSIGSFLVSFFGLPQITSTPERIAARYVGLYWGGAMVGRFVGSAVLQRLRSGVVLAFAATAACLLVVASMLGHGSTAMWTIILVGLFNSVMFPNIFTLGISNLGPLTSKGSSLMIAAIVGGALLPLFEGHLADRVGVQHAFIIPAACYVYIAALGFAARHRTISGSSVALITDPGA
jgi:FHS family L-fucose permease-like MFS transporter